MRKCLACKTPLTEKQTPVLLCDQHLYSFFTGWDNAQAYDESLAGSEQTVSQGGLLDGLTHQPVLLVDVEGVEKNG